MPPGKDAVRVCSQAGALATAFMIMLSPHYSWYFPFLAVFATVAPSRAVIWLSVAPLLLDVCPLPDHFLWRALVYGPALCVGAGELYRAAMPRAVALPAIVTGRRLRQGRAAALD